MRHPDIHAVLSPAERRLFSRLSTPQKIQDYLDTLPINFEICGETYFSARRVMGEKKAHCLEGALFAAAVLHYHGHKPLLLDFQTAADDEDHVVALFKQNGLWGAISKTNHAVLRYRDPMYRSVRELAVSYFHEYFMKNGEKTLRNYSAPFDLSRYKPEKWVTAGEDLFWLVEVLDKSRHFPLIPKKSLKLLRRASSFEARTVEPTEWNKKGRHNR